MIKHEYYIKQIENSGSNFLEVEADCASMHKNKTATDSSPRGREDQQQGCVQIS